MLRAYVEDMSPRQRRMLKEAVREKLQELEEEEERQNEIEEGLYTIPLFPFYKKRVDTRKHYYNFRKGKRVLEKKHVLWNCLVMYLILCKLFGIVSDSSVTFWQNERLPAESHLHKY